MEELKIENVDFRVGRLLLSKHLALGKLVSVLGQSKGYADQLCLRSPSEFPSGRVPLYTCACGDLDCGAVTVVVRDLGEDRIEWSAIGFESPWESGFSQSEYMQRTGPFVFPRAEYEYVLSSFR